MCTIYRFIIFISGACLLRAECQSPWVQFGSSCYYFSKVVKNFVAAEEYCRFTRGGYLAIIDSPAKTTFINPIITALYDHLGIDTYWIGGSDFAVEGEWRWVHTFKKLNYTNWGYTTKYGHEPNGVKGDTENCLAIHLFGNDFKWMDQFCGGVYNVICEKPYVSI